jgi:hypothetical protein
MAFAAMELAEPMQSQRQQRLNRARQGLPPRIRLIAA